MRIIRIFTWIATFLVLTGVVSGCSGSGTTIRPKTETYFIFDTIVTVKIYDERASDTHFSAIEQILTEIDAKMSRTSPTSEITQVNRSAGIEPVRVSTETLHLVKQAVQYADMTDGSFDPTVGPLVDLWGIGGDSPMRPDEVAVTEATSLVDYQQVCIDEEAMTIYLTEYGMTLDLGAIAKGYAADRIAEYLASQDMNSAIIDLGGNILATGYKPGGSKWTIGVQDPDESRGTSIGTLQVHDQSIVSSGVYERYFIEDGIRYHHILDTSTGYPVWNDLVSVTIVTASSTDADALSTSVFALGLKDGLSFVESREGVEAIFITEDKQIYVTSGLVDSFHLMDDRYTWIE